MTGFRTSRSQVKVSEAGSDSGRIPDVTTACRTGCKKIEVVLVGWVNVIISTGLISDLWAAWR